MPYSKSFPRQMKCTTLNTWDEIYLTEQEEREIEKKFRAVNIAIMQECMEDSKNLIDKHNLKRFQSDMVSLAIAFFHKKRKLRDTLERKKAKEKFDRKKQMRNN